MRLRETFSIYHFTDARMFVSGLYPQLQLPATLKCMKCNGLSMQAATQSYTFKDTSLQTATLSRSFKDTQTCTLLRLFVNLTTFFKSQTESGQSRKRKQ